MMTLKEIAGLCKRLMLFLASFSDCFGRREERDLLEVYVKGQLSDIGHKTAEAIALQFDVAGQGRQRGLRVSRFPQEPWG